VTARRAWYRTLFEGSWYRFDSHGHEDTDEEARRVADLAEVPVGGDVLDVPCGWGRITLPLARAGCRVTGVDLSPRLTAIARRDARRSGLPVRIRRGDMRRLPFRAEFDAALSLYSSFGFFDDPADDRAVLAGMARAVRPGGHVLLEGLARDALARGWQPTWFAERDGVRVLEDRTFDHALSRVTSRWEFQRADARGRYRTIERHTLTLRLYTPGELCAMANAVGLAVTRLLGGYDGREYGFDSTRLILVAQRARRRRAP
jgi:SAM-dependent methyltransferase